MAPLKQGRRMGRDDVSEYIYANLNPFLESGRGAKYPDDNVLPSVPLTAVDEYVLTTDDFGRTAITILPFVRNHYSTPTVAGTLFEYPYNWAIDSAPYTNSVTYEEVSQVFLDSRTVAAGVEISVVSPALTSQGRVFVGFVPMDFSGSYLNASNLPTTISQMLYTYKFHEISIPDLVDESVVIPFPTMDVGSTRYRSSYFPTLQAVDNIVEEKSIITSIETSPGWSQLVIMVEGANGQTPTLLVEMILHTENLVRTNGHIINSTPAAAPNRNAMDWIASFSARAESWIRSGDAGRFVTEHAPKALKAADSFARFMF